MSQHLLTGLRLSRICKSRLRPPHSLRFSDWYPTSSSLHVLRALYARTARTSAADPQMDSDPLQSAHGPLRLHSDVHDTWWYKIKILFKNILKIQDTRQYLEDTFENTFRKILLYLFISCTSHFERKLEHCLSLPCHIKQSAHAEQK